ncbi:hypothetical protein [Paenibacillus sp. PCH8]|nr:hypothetical protein [Paenibacillus sp. PCH8]
MTNPVNWETNREDVNYCPSSRLKSRSLPVTIASGQCPAGAIWAQISIVF